RLVVEGDFDFAIQAIVEQLPILIAGFDLLAADRDQVITDADLHPILIGWSTFVNITDSIATPRPIRFEIDSQIAGRNSTSRAATRRRRGAGMRSIQFANHLVNDVQQLLSIADVFYQRFVL